MGVWVPAEGKSWADTPPAAEHQCPLAQLCSSARHREGRGRRRSGREEAEGLVALKLLVVCAPCEVKAEALEEGISSLRPSSFVPFSHTGPQGRNVVLASVLLLDHPEHPRCIAGGSCGDNMGSHSIIGSNKNPNLTCLQNWRWLDLSGSVVARTSGTSSS